MKRVATTIILIGIAATFAACPNNDKEVIPPGNGGGNISDTLHIDVLGDSSYTLLTGTDSTVGRFKLHIPAKTAFNLGNFYYGAYSGSVSFSNGHVLMTDSTGNKIEDFDMGSDIDRSINSDLNPGNYVIKYTATPNAVGTLQFRCGMDYSLNGVKAPTGFGTAGPIITVK